MNSFSEAQKNFEYIQKIRRHIHQRPELGFAVHETANFVVQELSKFNNIKIKINIGQSGIVADLEAPSKNLINQSRIRRVALRADMDALPIQELNSCEYKSLYPGKAHMCGHDAHTAMLLGAAKILSDNQHLLSQHVRFIFQPNEENFPGGAPAMIKDGCLEGVDEIFGMHVWPLIEVKNYGLVTGPSMGKPDTFRIYLSGKGGHASIPHKAIDPIVIGAELVSAFQTIVSRNIYFQDTAVLSVTQFHGGTTHNVIPEKVFIEGTIRTFDAQISQLIINRMKEILKGFELAYQVKTHFEIDHGYPVLNNHAASINHTKHCLLKLFPEKNNESFNALPSLGGEDFSYYLKEIPGCYIFLGCANSKKGITNICHDPQFEIDEDCLIYGTALHCQWALDVNNNFSFKQS